MVIDEKEYKKIILVDIVPSTGIIGFFDNFEPVLVPLDAYEFYEEADTSKILKPAFGVVSYLN